MPRNPLTLSFSQQRLTNRLSIALSCFSHLSSLLAQAACREDITRGASSLLNLSLERQVMSTQAPGTCFLFLLSSTLSLSLHPCSDPHVKETLTSGCKFNTHRAIKTLVTRGNVISYCIRFTFLLHSICIHWTLSQ